MNKDEVAEILVNIGTLLELKGENPFKTRAYHNGARILETLSEPLEKLIAEDRLGEIKGIGEALQEKITTLVNTGRLPYYEELRASVPKGLVDMLEISGLGPKKLRALNQQLGIENTDQLEQACKEGKVANLAGFGEKTQQNLLEGIQRRRAYASRHLYSDAAAVAEPLLDALRRHPEVKRCNTAGSLRRHKEVIGDVDLLASSDRPAEVISYFAGLAGVQRVIARGETKASVIMEGGIQADLRVVSDLEYPFALAYFTGSKEHNIVMRQRAIARGLRLNEYGLFKSKEETRDPGVLVSCGTEQEIYSRLGLQFVPPELRESMGEFEAAEKNTLPQLLEAKEIKGSLHNHSTASDGHQTLQEIIDCMAGLGYAYWGITDHSKASFQANGLDATRLRKQIVEIREHNRRLEDQGKSFRLLTGAEVDILKDGRLDYPDDLLEELDVVVASIHQSFTLSEAEMTARLVGAANNPAVHMLGHLTGRLLLEREPYKVNHHAIIDACAETGTWIELNSHPLRLDMDWRHWPYAKSKGVRCVINCDAHRAEHAAYLSFGAGIARKGWLGKADVINTLPIEKLRKELARKRMKLQAKG